MIAAAVGKKSSTVLRSDLHRVAICPVVPYWPDMAENKNQHFVPRCHLKPFSLNGEGLAINLYNHAADRGIKNAPVRGQCSKSYFYGDDLELEKVFQRVEGRYAGVIEVITTRPHELTQRHLDTLRHFTHLQINRTETALARRRAAFEEMDEISYRGKEQFRNEAPDLSHRHMLVGAIKTYVETLPYIDDLEILLLRNDTGLDFITSDDPGVIINRLNTQRFSDKPFGLLSTGVQMVLPLTPRIALMCYDVDAYAVNARKGVWLTLDKVRDIEALNELQFIKCDANIYFREWSQLGWLRAAFKRSAPSRPASWFKSWIGTKLAAVDGREMYRRATDAEILSTATKIVSHSPVYPNPSKWLSVFKIRPKIMAYTDGSAVGFVRPGQAERNDLRKRHLIQLTPSYRPPTPLGPETVLLRAKGKPDDPKVMSADLYLDGPPTLRNRRMPPELLE